MAAIINSVSGFIPTSRIGKSVAILSGALLASPESLAKAFSWIIHKSTITVLGNEVAHKAKTAFTEKLVQGASQFVTPIRVIAGLILVGTLYVCRQSKSLPEAKEGVESSKIFAKNIKETFAGDLSEVGLSSFDVEDNEGFTWSFEFIVMTLANEANSKLNPHDLIVEFSVTNDSATLELGHLWKFNKEIGQFLLDPPGDTSPMYADMQQIPSEVMEAYTSKMTDFMYVQYMSHAAYLKAQGEGSK